MFRDSPWHISSFLRSIDRYGQSIPTFNIKGVSEIRTSVGGIVSGFTMILTLFYFSVKLQILVAGSDPVIN